MLMIDSGKAFLDGMRLESLATTLDARATPLWAGFQAITWTRENLTGASRLAAGLASKVRLPKLIFSPKKLLVLSIIRPMSSLRPFNFNSEHLPNGPPSEEKPLTNPMEMLLARYPTGSNLQNPNFMLIHARPNAFDEYQDPLYAALAAGSTIPLEKSNDPLRKKFWMKTYSENEGILEKLEAEGILQRTGEEEKQGYITLIAVETILTRGQWAEIINILKHLLFAVNPGLSIFYDRHHPLHIQGKSFQASRPSPSVTSFESAELFKMSIYDPARIIYGDSLCVPVCPPSTGFQSSMITGHQCHLCNASPIVFDYRCSVDRNLNFTTGERSFERFPKFPPEIRCLVWRHLVPVRTVALITPINYAIMPRRLFESPAPITRGINKESRIETFRYFRIFRREGGYFRVPPMWVSKEDRPYIHYDALNQHGLVRVVFITMNDGAQNWIKEVEDFRIIDINSRELKDSLDMSPNYRRECFRGLPNLKRLTMSLHDHDPIHPSDIDWLQEQLTLSLISLRRRPVPEIIWEVTRRYNMWLSRDPGEGPHAGSSWTVNLGITASTWVLGLDFWLLYSARRDSLKMFFKRLKILGQVSMYSYKGNRPGHSV
ncbi:hypothetical protein GLAREA_11754 [Glarea lozoyensis ATCC 20868]|uniref:2EXR domain-containing protein n=1 Tax=Glarea lozoyensis (strain ATCC 20868 / MF5171) TaxID=1116229 RepID=S3DEU4_GLAL2|nr:uncharacterized protein GLAREA_11754 [Glarea lozoyensis ATCC 20868]EPE25173.1 hypothetical protein GLAREA_11754 [Glarea lozoyensis ATCC 20868]